MSDIDLTDVIIIVSITALGTVLGNVFGHFALKLITLAVQP